jgi:hypothetical protein
MRFLWNLSGFHSEKGFVEQLQDRPENVFECITPLRILGEELQGCRKRLRPMWVAFLN